MPSSKKLRPSPIRPLTKHARAYDLALRRAYLNPMFRDLRRRLANANAAQQAYRIMDQWVLAMVALPRAGVPVKLIQEALNRMQGYHKARLIKTFSRALGVNIRPLLADPIIASFLTQKVAENVDLIRTIPTRFHAGLKSKLVRELEQAPFDQARLRGLLKREYKSSGYNLRRLTRDQTNKTIGGLTRIRHHVNAG